MQRDTEIRRFLSRAVTWVRVHGNGLPGGFCLPYPKLYPDRVLGWLSVTMVSGDDATIPSSPPAKPTLSPKGSTISHFPYREATLSRSDLCFWIWNPYAAGRLRDQRLFRSGGARAALPSHFHPLPASPGGAHRSWIPLGSPAGILLPVTRFVAAAPPASPLVVCPIASSRCWVGGAATATAFTSSMNVTLVELHLRGRLRTSAPEVLLDDLASTSSGCQFKAPVGLHPLRSLYPLRPLPPALTQPLRAFPGAALYYGNFGALRMQPSQSAFWVQCVLFRPATRGRLCSVGQLV